MYKAYIPLFHVINFMFFSPTDRSDEDLHIIYAGMKDLHTFEKFHPMLLQQLCYYSYYEDLEKGVTCEYKLSGTMTLL